MTDCWYRWSVACQCIEGVLARILALNTRGLEFYKARSHRQRCHCAKSADIFTRRKKVPSRSLMQLLPFCSRSLSLARFLQLKLCVCALVLLRYTLTSAHSPLLPQPHSIHTERKQREIQHDRCNGSRTF